MLPGILPFTQKIVDANKDALSPGIWIGIDDLYNHRLNATEHIMDLTGHQNGKIVDFKIVSRATRSKPGNCRETANVSVLREHSSLDDIDESHGNRPRQALKNGKIHRKNSLDVAIRISQSGWLRRSWSRSRHGPTACLKTSVDTAGGGGQSSAPLNDSYR